MKAKKLIKDIQAAIDSSEEYDPDIIFVQKDKSIIDKITVTTSPLEQGEQEFCIILRQKTNG